MTIDWTAVIVAALHGGPGLAAAVGVWVVQHPRLKRVERAANGKLAERDARIAVLLEELHRLSEPPPP
jgi:hypothetical protein